MAKKLVIGIVYAHELGRPDGHVACTLGGVNYESRGGRGIVKGGSARGATNRLFRHRFYIVLSDTAAMRAKRWADAQVGEPYRYGQVPGYGGDCSGYVSGIICKALNRPVRRLFSTEDWTQVYRQLGFRPGTGPSPVPEAPRPATLAGIYAIQPDGKLLWYRHDGRENGSGAWTGPKQVGHGWYHFKGVFAGGAGILYAIQPDGELLWYRHDGRENGSGAWTGPKQVGHGWHHFKGVFAGGAGILYAIQPDGELLWYRHDGRENGSGAWTGPKQVGHGWHHFKGVFAGGAGILYAIQPDGELLWYRHDGRENGSGAWTGPKQVGHGWHHFKGVFAGGAGILYAIQPDGELLWYRHDGRENGSGAWTGPKQVGHGWHHFKGVFGL